MRRIVLLAALFLLCGSAGSAVATDYSINMTFSKSGNLTPTGIAGDGGTALFINLTVQHTAARGDPVLVRLEGFDGYLSDVNEWNRTMAPTGNGTRTFRVKTDYRPHPLWIHATVDPNNSVEERSEQNNKVIRRHVPETAHIVDISYPAVGGDGQNTTVAVTVKKQGQTPFEGVLTMTVTQPTPLTPRRQPVHLEGGETKRILFHGLWSSPPQQDTLTEGPVRADIRLVSNGSVHARATIHPPRTEPYDDRILFANPGDWRPEMEHIRSCDGIPGCRAWDEVSRSIRNGYTTLSTGGTGFCGVTGFKQSVRIPDGSSWLVFHGAVNGSEGNSAPAGIRLNDRFYTLPLQNTGNEGDLYAINLSHHAENRLRIAVVLDSRTTDQCTIDEPCSVAIIPDTLTQREQFAGCDTDQQARRIQVRDMAVVESRPADAILLPQGHALPRPVTGWLTTITTWLHDTAASLVQSITP